MLSTLPSMLMDHGLNVGPVHVAWSIVLLVAIVVIGLLLIRAAITLVKVGILVAIGVAVFLLVQFALKNFNF